MAAGYQDLFLNQAETFLETVNLSDASNMPYDGMKGSSEP